MSSIPLENITVTGYGCISAAGFTSKSVRKSIDAAIVCSEEVGEGVFPGQFTAPCFLVAADPLRPFQGSGLVPCGINRTILLALTAIEEALIQAGLSSTELQQKKVGVAMGTTVGCTFHNEDYYKEWRKGSKPDPEALTDHMASNLAAKIQDILGITGPRVVITNACASGTDAIGVAKTWLEYGLCDIAIAGGADGLSRVACHGFKSLMLVSTEPCRPFDRRRKGLNIGEGAGVVVMESQPHLAARNGEIQGWIRGYGIAGDAYHPTAPHPQGRGLQLAVKKALGDARIEGDDIAMINAHGTGTPANDLAETNAIAALAFDSKKVPIVSTKGATGHTLGAAGGIEAVLTLMALNQGELSGTIGCEEPDLAFHANILQQGQKKQLWGKVGLSQSLAFGGNNAALVIEGVDV